MKNELIGVKNILEPLRFGIELTDPDEIEDFIKYMERPATKEEKAYMEEAREIYKNTKVVYYGEEDDDTD